MDEIVGLRVRLRAKIQEAEEKKTKKSKQRGAEKRRVALNTMTVGAFFFDQQDSDTPWTFQKSAKFLLLLTLGFEREKQINPKIKI